MCFLVLSAQWGENWDPVLRGRIKRTFVFMAVRPTAPTLCWAWAAMLLLHPEQVGGVLSAETDQLKRNTFGYWYSDTSTNIQIPPGSSLHGILQERILERVVIPFSRGSSGLRDWTLVSHIAGIFFTIRAIREAHLQIPPTKQLDSIIFEDCQRCQSSSQQLPYTASKQVWEPPPKQGWASKSCQSLRDRDATEKKLEGVRGRE